MQNIFFRTLHTFLYLLSTRFPTTELFENNIIQIGIGHRSENGFWWTYIWVGIYLGLGIDLGLDIHFGNEHIFGIGH
jgi:hypothetical protein